MTISCSPTTLIRRSIAGACVTLALSLCGATPTWTQETVAPERPVMPKDYTVEASLSAGPAISIFRYPRTPISPRGPVAGASTMLRIMWHPGRLLSFGIATGYTIFSIEDFTPVWDYLRDTIVPGKAVMYGFPTQVAVSMQKDGLDLGLGMGPYFMVVDLFDHASHTRSTRTELGLTLFASYEWELGGGLVAGPSIRCIILAYRGVVTLIPEYRVRYDLLSY